MLSSTAVLSGPKTDMNNADSKRNIMPFRIRRKSVIAISIVVLTTLMLVYILIGQSIINRLSAEPDFQRIELQLMDLNGQTVRNAKKTMQHHIHKPDDNAATVTAAIVKEKISNEMKRIKPAVTDEMPSLQFSQCSSSVVPLDSNLPPNVTVQMLSIYKKLQFDNPDGGVWKQGWNLRADPSDWTARRPLRVFVVPHSHNDPGWIKTFEEYYKTQTKSILDSMLQQMTDNPSQTFIWAEISYFSRWFEELDTTQKHDTIALVRSGRLEFVTGGWVMADEANSHWISILQQLSEGQTWLRRTMNVTPIAGWSIDPFGYSATMPLLLKHAGIKNTLIQRTHYSVKKRLGKLRQLEFRWRQLWDNTGDTEIFTHMMPFYSYDVPHTCGPDPKICCQFDFKRLPGYGLHCPWNASPQVINDKNVASRAKLILDQWHKKATLYRSNAVLIPLGDDFRYSQAMEWEAQRNNYERIFDYLNNEPSLNVQAKFATLGEYFEAVHESNVLDNFPTLSGDFFTYADRDDHYWSGFFSSRPYHKRFDRILMAYLRSAELLYSWLPWPEDSKFDTRLRNARQALSLFQHHDGITGTARDYVMQDYAERMDAALVDCKHIIQQSLYRHLTEATIWNADPAFTYFHIDDSRVSPGSDQLGDHRPTIILGSELPDKYVVVHNSLPIQRNEVVEVLVSKPTVCVTDLQSNRIVSQVGPMITWHRDGSGTWTPLASTTKYRLLFIARIPSMGARTYVVRSVDSVDDARLAGTTFADLTLYNAPDMPMPSLQLGRDYPNALKVEHKLNAFTLRSGDQESGAAATFSKHGLLVKMQSHGDQFNSRVSFVKYGARRTTERSGAYLFLPEIPAVRLSPESHVSQVLVERGELESRCASGHEFGVHKSILRQGENALEIRNLVDISHMDNVELAMRIETDDITNEDVFYTDLNGMQSIRRHRFSKLPLQANYYPVPTYIYIEDNHRRMTLLTAQPLGGSSVENGMIEIMQDRRLQFDDNRGLGQGVLDNRPVLNIFRLMFEDVAVCVPVHSEQTSGALTISAHREQQALIHPVEKLIWHENVWPGVMSSFGEDREPLDTDFVVAVSRNLPDLPVSAVGRRTTKERETANSALGLVVHRTRLRTCKSDASLIGKFNIRRAFSVDADRPIHKSKITLLQRDAVLDRQTGNDVDMCPMDIRAFIIGR